MAQGRGLIVTISSMGGLRYLFNVPYGVGKAAVRLLLNYSLQSLSVESLAKCKNCVIEHILVRSAGSRHGV